MICLNQIKKVQPDGYEVEVTEFEDVHECNVRNRAGGCVQEVIIPINPDDYGSRFGKCSCGVTKTKTIPCVHMVAVMKSTKVPGLTSMNMMPSWCYTAVWREQFGKGMVLNTGFDIHYLNNNYQPNPKLRYCPKMAATEKTGRKKNMNRHKSPLELSAKKKKHKKGNEKGCEEEVMEANAAELLGKGQGEEEEGEKGET